MVSIRLTGSLDLRTRAFDSLGLKKVNGIVRIE